MKLDLPEDFARKVEHVNLTRYSSGPATIAVTWNPRVDRWQVFAIPRSDSAHPNASNELTRKLVKPLPDDSGRLGVLLFTWAKRDSQGNDVGPEFLDDRIFDTLDWCDSFRSRRHYEETVEAPELQAEIIQKKRTRDIAGASAEYFRRLDSLTVTMNPKTRSGGDWRHRWR